MARTPDGSPCIPIATLGGADRISRHRDQADTCFKDPSRVADESGRGFGSTRAPNPRVRSRGIHRLLMELAA